MRPYALSLVVLLLITLRLSRYESSGINRTRSAPPEKTSVPTMVGYGHVNGQTFGALLY